MATGYISKQSMSDREHLLDIGRRRHDDVATNPVIIEIGQAREVDVRLPARVGSVNSPPKKRMIQGLRAIGMHRRRFEPMSLPLPGMMGQRCMGAWAGIDGGPVWLEAVAPCLSQGFQQRPPRGETALQRRKHVDGVAEFSGAFCRHSQQSRLGSQFDDEPMPGAHRRQKRHPQREPAPANSSTSTRHPVTDLALADRSRWKRRGALLSAERCHRAPPAVPHEALPYAVSERHRASAGDGRTRPRHSSANRNPRVRRHLRPKWSSPAS